MGFIWSLIIGGLIGWAAGAITGKGVPFGIIGNIIAGFIGSCRMCSFLWFALD